jgi:hypothetical protein
MSLVNVIVKMMRGGVDFFQNSAFQNLARVCLIGEQSDALNVELRLYLLDRFSGDVQ